MINSVPTRQGMTVVDPPGGWKYGFPAPLEKDYMQQLINAGYPTSEIDLALKYSRYWCASENENVDRNRCVL